MAATSVITCPECHKKFKGREEFLGRRVRCPRCSHSFIVQKLVEDKVDPGAPSSRKAITAGTLPDDIIPLAPLAPSPGAAGEEEQARLQQSALDEELTQDGNPYDVNAVDLAPRCPNCANEMPSREALICLVCGYNTQTRRTPETKKTIEHTGSEHFAWLLPGLLCGLGVFLVYVLHLFNCFVVPELVNKENWTSWLFDSEAMRLWVGVIGIGFMWVFGYFAHRRLIFQPLPPEKEMD